ncbi:VCBS repeat-containing protein [Pseudotenacibaculum sp. MALMAid0570]
MRYFTIAIFIGMFLSCKSDETIQSKKPVQLFSSIQSSYSNIHFKNEVKEDLYFNFLNYPYIYNGGGVAVGDINNDGLEDIYFTANQGNNKLYINKGNFQFEDITDSAAVNDAQGWSTGVTIIDINNDGWLDIYVCKSGSLQSHEQRKNKLYINQKNNTFKESAKEYGLDFYGFSIQSYFFDMDNDGDLDLYLVNHRVDFRNNITLDLDRDKKIEDYGSDQLYRNDSGKYTNITNASGVANKAWGLSASIGDFNNDGWQDIFVANDFFHGDFLYINQKDGTFKDQSLQSFKHLSNSSMGSDYEDVNNDLQPDLIVLDMLAEDHIRAKNNMAAMNTNSFNMMVDAGYHYQYMSNMLQLNNGDGTYSEIGQLAGIAKTDWSWAPLIADFDNDGHKDVFITNGIEHDLSNQDFRNQMRANIMNRKKVTLEEAIKMMPSTKLSNYIFKNNQDLTFTNTTKEWGLDRKVNSNGTAYADLDNDGDLDLIVNNQSEKASVYKNNAKNNTLSISLKGPSSNVGGIGTKVYVYTKGTQQFKEFHLGRGYQSSVTHKLHFGLGTNQTVDSIKVVWPDLRIEQLENSKANATIVFNYKNSYAKKSTIAKTTSFFKEIVPKSLGISYKQKENEFNDFDLQLLLPQKQSEITSAIAVADINNDGLDDFFAGNAKNARASLYVQKPNGTFVETNQKLFEKEKKYEDTNALFFDADGDSDIDLFVSSGGYEVTKDDSLLEDRIYINDGKGNFTRSNKFPKIYSNTKAVAVTDYDKDGDIDIFIGGRVTHGKYPLNDPSFLLENQNGKFINVTRENINGIEDVNLINDAVFSDYDNDGDDDLLVVGEWMPLNVFENINGKFIKKEVSKDQEYGWYQTIKEIDIDNDGDKDYLLGNWGTNNKFHPTKKKPLHVYADYLDQNNSYDIVLSKVSKTGSLIPVRGKQCSSEQTPFLKNKIGTYNEFATSTLKDIYGEDKLKNANHFIATDFTTVVKENLGNGQFKTITLPNQAQLSPTLAFETYDFNNDGLQDIFGVGNIYDAEVETIRYDASKGYVLFNGENKAFTFLNDKNYFNNAEAKAIKKIQIGSKTHFIILNKNSELKILKTNY